ncbi:MAG TPA: amino acid permease [Bacteroidia bacterium]|nr:amino acid permease [Bacteroidia bacterium]
MNLFRKKNIDDLLNKQYHPGVTTLKKHLKVRDLTAFGIAAIIGAGIFSTIGKASAEGGPAVILLFIFTAVACGFAAFCYAEFASMVPVSGSAYTYSYVSFGELFAWIIGWALIMEYAIGNIVIAISWSGYFSSLLEHIRIPAFGINEGIHLPAWSGIDYFSAKRAFAEVAAGTSDSTVVHSEAYRAWVGAPVLGGLKIILDIPAIFINIIITWLVYRGIKETRNASNIMVGIKLMVLVLVIFSGFSYIDTANWNPFMPEGLGGVLAGVSAVFFAYIGFDAISTTAEECVNPQRDLPKSMIYSIVICTVLYMLIALTLTGMTNYKLLDVDDPLSFVFKSVGLDWISGVIAVSAVVAMTSVLLVFQMGQPRIWMTMGRDGLLPPAFAKIHPKHGTPGFSTIVTGLLVGIPLLFIDMDTVVDLCSIGTLFAFVLVCGGVLMLQNKPDLPRKFKVPYINGKIIIPVIYLGLMFWLGKNQQEWLSASVNPLNSIQSLPMFLFFVVFAILAVLSFVKRLSFIPVAGILMCLYLMAQINLKNWIGFTIWLIAGLVIYFSYSYRHSNLSKLN